MNRGDEAVVGRSCFRCFRSVPLRVCTSFGGVIEELVPGGGSHGSQCVQILKGCPVKMDSVGLWGSRLLVGCMDGSLRMFMDNPADSFKEADVSAASYVLKDTRIGFAKKPVTCMNVLQSKNLVISLSDAVAIHSLPEFDVVAFLTKTRGANLYAWDEQRGMLCVANAKRLFVYKYDGSKDFSEVKQLPAPDVVKCITWVGDSICLGIKREHANPLAVTFPNGELLLGKVTNPHVQFL